MDKNFLVGLGAIFLIFLVVMMFIVGGFYLLGPVFVLVLFVLAAITAIISNNYEEITEFGSSIKGYIKEKENGNK